MSFLFIYYIDRGGGVCLFFGGGGGVYVISFLRLACACALSPPSFILFFEKITIIIIIIYGAHAHVYCLRHQPGLKKYSFLFFFLGGGLTPRHKPHVPQPCL